MSEEVLVKQHLKTGVVLASAVVASCLGTTDAAANDKKKLVAPTVFSIETRKRTRREIGEFIKYSGSVSVAAAHESEIKRDDVRRDQSRDVSAQLAFAVRADLGFGTTAFVRAKASAKRRNRSEYGVYGSTRLDWNEAVLSVRLSDVSQLNFGRMRFSDPNKWVADASVTGVHFGRIRGSSGFELAAVRGTRKNTSNYVLAHLSKAEQAKKQGAFAILENGPNGDRLHVSGYQNRTVSARISHQWNVGLVMGDAANGRSAGLGIDWRGVRKLKGDRLNPQLTLGFAIGSPGFQQTGLHSNKTYDGGQTQFNRYGYLYRPELTNLAVFTLAYGLRPSRKFSVDFGMHIYAQPRPSTTATTGRIQGQTTGRSGYLGSEISIAGAWRPSKTTKIEFGAARFAPGAAYKDRSAATRLFARATFSF